MIYLLNAFFSSLYMKLVERYKFNLLIFIPIISIWVIIVGQQYEVGTDYHAYYHIFSNESILNNYRNKGEYFFYYIVKLMNALGITGQGGFFIFAIIQSILFYMILRKLKLYKNSIFIFLFLVYGVTFYNQMNTIRSYTGCYLMTLALLENNILFSLNYYFMGSFMHKSISYLFPLLLLRKFKKKLTNKFLFGVLIFSVISLILPIENIIIDIICRFVPRYYYYVNHEYFQELSFLSVITKIIYVPFYIYALKYIPQEAKHTYLFKLGFISYSIRIFCLNFTVLNRIGELFSILMILPIYYLIEQKLKKREYTTIFILFLIVISLFIFKTIILPKGEYLYKSYLFK